MTLTYELREQGKAERYYQMTGVLAVELEKKMEILQEELGKFIECVEKKEWEALRSSNEYGIELVYYAVLFQWVQAVLSGNPLGKSTRRDWQSSCQWMKESGEFKEEVVRMEFWNTFFEADLSVKEWEGLCKKLEMLTEYVSTVGEQYLKCYLPNLEQYLEKYSGAWKVREDAGLILRDASCYYINMIGAQVLNRCYNADFKCCDKVYIFLPGCMAARKENCQAIEKKDGYLCQACDASCQVNQLTAEYSKVRIVYHGSQMESNKVEAAERVGVVGVACVLNLIAGGLKAKRLGYIPKCVILNECGCNIHWDEKGIVTSLDADELRVIMG